MFDGLVQPTVLAKQLNQLYIHQRVGRPGCQLGLEEVEQLIPTLLALTTQQALLNGHRQT